MKFIFSDWLDSAVCEKVEIFSSFFFLGCVLEMKIQVGNDDDDEEEKALVIEVLGTCAFDYLLANSFINESMLMAIGSGKSP